MRSGIVLIIEILIKCIIMTISLLGNSLVIACILSNRRLRNFSNKLVGSLALTNILGTIFSMGSKILEDIYYYRYANSAISTTFCIMRLGVVSYTFIVRIHHLLSIAVDRYFAIIKPFSYTTCATNSTLVYVLMACWIPGVFISFLPTTLGVIFKKEVWKEIKAGTKCAFVIESYWQLLDLIIFWIPCIAMIFIYTRIFLKARQHAAQLKRISQFNNTKKSMKSLGLILGTFIICWMPLFTLDIALAYSLEHDETIRIAVHYLYWLGLISYCSDPFVYGFQNKQFRYEALYIASSVFLCKNERRVYERKRVQQDWYTERTSLQRNSPVSVEN